MAWEEIKYAVNSTLGTDEFLPLDEIIKNLKTYVASDEHIIDLVTSQISVQAISTTPVQIGFIKPKVNGSIRLKVTGYRVTTGYNLNLGISRDGGEIEQVGSFSTSEDTLTEDIIIHNNEEISILVYTNRGNGYVTGDITSASINASVVDTSMIEYTPYGG